MSDGTDQGRGGGAAGAEDGPATVRLARCRIDGRGDRLFDIDIRDGRIAAIGDPATRPAGASIDLDGALVVPAFVDGHIHLDKTLLGTPWRPHEPGDAVADRIRIERRVRASLPRSVTERAGALLAQVLRLGTTALRTHVDIDPDVGLANFEQVAALREAWRDRVDIQIAAFPQSGLAGADVRDLCEEALRRGADAVGAVDPQAIDGDAKGVLDALFRMADRHGAAVDIHLHEDGEAGLRQVAMIADLTRRFGLGGRAAISHAFCLATSAPEALSRAAGQLAEAGVAIMTAVPGPIAVMPVKPLRAAGVTVFAGSDNIRDVWSPLGTGDMLDRARLAADRSGYRTDDDLRVAFDLVTAAGARALGLPDRGGLTVGAAADLVVLAVGSVPEAVASVPVRDIVIRRGKVIARRENAVRPTTDEGEGR